MSFRQVRREILEEHCALRLGLANVEALCNRLEHGDERSAHALVNCGRALYERFAAHLVHEDQILISALGVVAGRAIAEKRSAEHREQRELLEYLLGRLDRPGYPALLLARELRHFAELVREDMQEEEEFLLRRDRPVRSLDSVKEAPIK